MLSSALSTRQFQAGNSQAVRLPVGVAFPPKTELIVRREGQRVIIEPKDESLANLPRLFGALKRHHTGKRPAFEPESRDWS